MLLREPAVVEGLSEVLADFAEAVPAALAWFAAEGLNSVAQLKELEGAPRSQP